MSLMKIIKWLEGNQKKAIQEVRFNTYNELYSELGAKDGENNIYKLVKTREMKTK
jgi:hypothetical protein